MIKASTQREHDLVKQTRDELMLDFFITLSNGMTEVDPIVLVKIKNVIASAEKARLN